MFCLVLLLLLLSICSALAVRYAKHHFSYWKRRGFPYDVDSRIPFGSMWPTVKKERSMGMTYYDIYTKTKGLRYVGIYQLWRPAVLIRDVDLVRHVLAQDFASFHDRGVYVDEKKDPISATLFAMEGESWRTMRHNLAPSFTLGKLKAMFGTADDIGNKMIEHLRTIVPESGAIEVDMKDVMTNYAIDIIGSVIFGLEINSFENPTNKFRMIRNTVRRDNLLLHLFSILLFQVPAVARFLFRIGFQNPVALKMGAIIKETIEHRERNNIVRKDMLQLLMQLRNTGRINDDDNHWEAKVDESAKADGNPKEAQTKAMSIESIAAQAFIFYIAGQETTASTAAFTLFELAQYPELLKRAQTEIDEVLAKHGGRVSYDALQEMPFLEMCISETLRKYPGLPMLNRQCTKDYKIPGSEDHIIEKGTPVIISLFGLHRDPDHFPDPDVYDPDRFAVGGSGGSRNYNPAAYMPFGEGPRHCIAQRMGHINSKLAVVKILANFDLAITERREIVVDNHSLPIIAKGGVKLTLSRKR